MNWIEQALRDLQRRSRADAQQGGTGGVQAPAAGVNGPQPTGPAGDMTMNGPWRGQALMAALGAYQERTKRKQDPLLDRQTVTRRPGGGGFVSEKIPATMGTSGINTSSNARRGLSFIPYTLADGTRLHVYYGPKGQRTVIRLPKR